MFVATKKTCWQPAGCEASFSQRSLGKSVYRNVCESFIGEKIFGKGSHAASWVSCSTSAFRAARSAVTIRRPRSVSNQRCVPETFLIKP